MRLLLSHDFANLDDNLYVTENTQVQRSLTREGIIWAFNTTDMGHRIPMAWLSYEVNPLQWSNLNHFMIVIIQLVPLSLLCLVFGYRYMTT